MQIFVIEKISSFIFCVVVDVVIYLYILFTGNVHAAVDKTTKTGTVVLLSILSYHILYYVKQKYIYRTAHSMFGI